MGALAPVSPWLPEDDLLLKNSIEAGASLESLAKGAVQFTRKFTVEELQDRWHSLLYDPVVSADASLHMIECEHSAPTLPSKFTRAGNSKENKYFSEKRKAESVRSCYYALCKRIHNEPFNSVDLSFLVAPSNENFFRNVDESLSGNCMLGDPMSNHFGLHDSNLDVMHHSFPEIRIDDGAACRDGYTLHSFHGELDHPIEEDFPILQGNTHDEIPRIFEAHESFMGNDDGVEELPGEVPSLFEGDNTEANSPSTCGHFNGDPGNVCSEFNGNQAFPSSIPECGAPFQNLEYSSPLPEMPIWRPVEEISLPTIPVDHSLREKDLHTVDTFALPDDAEVKDTSGPGYDFVHVNSKLKMEMSCDELKSAATNTEGYLEELSKSLRNFNNHDELLFMDDDGKEMIDKSYYDGLSLLLNSPNEAKQDHMPSPEPETSVTPDYVTSGYAICPPESVEKVQIPSSSSASDCQFPEQNDDFICCTLNTEDPYIPCNDDVFLSNKLQPPSVSIATHQNFKEAGKPFSSSVKDFSGDRKISERDPVLMTGGKENSGHYHTSSHRMGSQLHPVGISGVKFQLPNRDFSQLVSQIPCVAPGGSIQINSMNVGTDTLQRGRMEENKEIPVVKDPGHTLTNSSLEKPASGSDGCRGHERNASGTKLELNDLATVQDCQVSNAEVGSVQILSSEPTVNPSTSEPEDISIESDDDDVPYFSDIEAMILDMDLYPNDMDIYEQEVSKYQHEETRRAIIRLEQGAHSYIQRAIASHGAYAVLYGRYSKHFIKKPEVLLGRATEEVVVDIDLGRERRANKISRRQAVINMDKAGSFHLKNLGQCSISVNNKEVPPGQSLSLSSSCLIEIRGMPFIFETNETCIKRYLNGISKEKSNSSAPCLNHGGMS